MSTPPVQPAPSTAVIAAPAPLPSTAIAPAGEAANLEVEREAEKQRVEREAENQRVEREAAGRRAREQASSERAAREMKAKALADRQRQEIEMLRAERDTARRQAEELAARSPQRDQQPSPAILPRAPTPTPARATTVKELCARSRDPITRVLCEARECINPKNWNDPYCKQQQLEASQRARPDN